MNMKMLGIAAAALAFSGCIVVDGTPIYSTCGVVSECESLAEACYATSVTRGSLEFTNNTCTLFCSRDTDCPRGSTGDRGRCENLSGDFVCNERCLDDFDCPSGYVCEEVDVAPGDPLCIPG